MAHDAARGLALRRTKIGVGIFAAIVLLAVVGPFVAPYSPTEFVAAPYPPPAIAKLLAPTTSATTC